MPVDSVHEDYDKYKAIWATARDACAGEKAIKDRTTTYLPGFPNEVNTAVSKSRYTAYITRATFVEITGRTLHGLIGGIFRKEPVIDLPGQLDYMEENCNGQGQGLKQFAKRICSEILQTGRAGILTDYPTVMEDLTEEQAQELQAKFSFYPAESITNWREGSFITLREYKEVIDPTDPYKTATEKQYRVLTYDDGGNYIQKIFNKDLQQVGDDIYPRTAAGVYWKKIPFEFVGAEDNMWPVDGSPLYGLAKVNIAHYRNSADYEEGIHIHGQGTLFISSKMSNHQFNQANPNGVLMGARTGHHIGEGGQPYLLQMDANNAAGKAMEDKEKQMVSIGARLITISSGNMTAEQARIDASSETSVLSTITANVSSALRNSLRHAAELMGGGESMEFKLNEEFFPESLSPQEAMALIQLADRGDIAQTDIRAKLRRAGWVDPGRTDEDIDEDAEVNTLNE